MELGSLSVLRLMLSMEENDSVGCFQVSVHKIVEQTNKSLFFWLCPRMLLVHHGVFIQVRKDVSYR